MRELRRSLVFEPIRFQNSNHPFLEYTCICIQTQETVIPLFFNNITCIRSNSSFGQTQQLHDLLLLPKHGTKRLILLPKTGASEGQPFSNINIRFHLLGRDHDNGGINFRGWNKLSFADIHNEFDISQKLHVHSQSVEIRVARVSQEAAGEFLLKQERGGAEGVGAVDKLRHQRGRYVVWDISNHEIKLREVRLEDIFLNNL